MATPKTLIQKILKSSTQMLSGNLIMSLTGILSGYFFALYLGPAQYGIWQTALVISGYSVLLMLSLPITMTRDYVQARKEGNMDYAEQMANLVFTYSLIVRGFSIIGILGYSYFFISNDLFRYSMYAVAALFLIDIPAAFGGIMSKALNEYHKITWQKLIQGIGILLTVPLVYYFGFKALLFGVLISHIAAGIYFYFYRPVSFKLYWNSKLLRKLIIVAFPLFLVTATSSIFVSIDRLIIASFLSFTDVGLYSLSSFLSMPLNLLISSFSIVLFTRLNEEYGTQINQQIIKKHVIIPQNFFSLILPVFMGIGLLALPYFVEIFLPKYKSGILAAQINIFSIYFFLLTNFSANALFVLKKQKYTAMTFFISGIIKVGISISLIKSGYGIEGVAMASVIAYFIYDLVMLRIIYFQIEANLKDYLKHVLNIIIPVIIPFVFVLFTEKLLSSFNILNGLNTLFIVELIFLLCMSPFLYKAYIFVKTKLISK